MQTIKKGIVNRVGFTVKELAICDEPMEFRIEFTSQNSKDLQYEVTKTPTNLGDRLQIFEIEEGVDVDFQLTGYYSYEIYQTTSDNLVEVGLVRVISESSSGQVVTNSKNPQVYGS